jgi:hypothetical protein
MARASSDKKATTTSRSVGAALSGMGSGAWVVLVGIGSLREQPDITETEFQHQ